MVNGVAGYAASTANPRAIVLCSPKGFLDCASTASTLRSE